LFEENAAVRRRPLPDLARVVAVLVVVVGHWLASSLRYADGRFRHDNVLADVTWTQWLTLGFQVMPVFFLVGGHVNATSWIRWSARGGDWATWLGRRAVRLLVPASLYVAVMTAAVTTCVAAGIDGGELELAAWAVALHLWFLPVYLGLVAATPVMHAAHQRWGVRVPVALTAAVAAVNTAVLGWHVEPLGWLNYALVWVAVYQLGFAWQDGTLARFAAVLAVGGAAAVVLLTGPGPFPVSMVGVAGAPISNTSPPSIALLAFAVTQSSLLILAEPRSSGGHLVNRLTPYVMTMFLWHMVPVVLIALAAYPADLLPQPHAGSVLWWEWRVIWVLLLSVLFVPLVTVAERVERALVRRVRTDSGPVTSGGRVLLVTGTASAAFGLLLITLHGFAPGGTLPPVALLTFAVGLVAVLGSTATTRRG
jgi:hypothetical protein